MVSNYILFKTKLLYTRQVLLVLCRQTNNNNFQFKKQKKLMMPI